MTEWKLFNINFKKFRVYKNKKNFGGYVEKGLILWGLYQNNHFIIDVSNAKGSGLSFQSQSCSLLIVEVGFL